MLEPPLIAVSTSAVPAVRFGRCSLRASWPPSLSFGSLIWLPFWQQENEDSSLLFLK